jgi:hypothetical protein
MVPKIKVAMPTASTPPPHPQDQPCSGEWKNVRAHLTNNVTLQQTHHARARRTRMRSASLQKWKESESRPVVRNTTHARETKIVDVWLGVGNTCLHSFMMVQLWRMTDGHVRGGTKVWFGMPYKFFPNSWLILHVFARSHCFLLQSSPPRACLDPFGFFF